MARPAKPSYERNVNYNITIPPHLVETWEVLRARFKSSGRAWTFLANYYTDNETTALNNYTYCEKYLNELTVKLANGEAITQNNIDSIKRLLSRQGEEDYKAYLKTQGVN